MVSKLYEPFPASVSASHANDDGASPAQGGGQDEACGGARWAVVTTMASTGHSRYRIN